VRRRCCFVHRRKLLQLGFGALAGAGFAAGLGLPSRAFAEEGQAAAPRALAIHNLNTGEKLEALYFDKGAYVPDALAAVNKLMRDRRTGAVHPIDPKLLDLLVVLRGQVEASACYELICGYRSPATNASMHAKSRQVAKNSLHPMGMAADIRIAGLDVRHLHNAALALRGGGVGLYPVSNFVHLDVGPVRHWQGT
jgi:uncharacterized protein YcbK (DUF882 family)